VDTAAPGGLNEIIRRVEREHIGNVLTKFTGDRAAAARELGLDIGALELKLKELDL
jgi:DNA-binding NtrC family response regulator